MTQTEYEQNRAECLIAFYEDQSLTTHSVCQALYYAFDRGYALGKVKDLISQDEIDKAAEDYVSFDKSGKCYPSYLVERACCNAFKDGADFALGKQTETIAQEDIEKAAEAFATPPIGNGGMFTRQQVKELLVRFAQLLLSKQEKDAEDTVIQGWVACDKGGMVRLHYTEPKRTDGGYWQGAFKSSYLPKGKFPSLTWSDEPIECEIIIKPKKR